MGGLITVSNGVEFLRISPSDLAHASADGFYRPLERGLTIVSNATHLFEIPLSDVDAAKANGYHDLLESERSMPSAPKTANRLTAYVTTAPTASEQVVRYDEPESERSEVMEGLSQAEQDEEEERLAREQELEEAEGLQWYLIYMRQWMEARSVLLERQLGSHGISIAIHVALFLLLASLMMVNDNEPKGVVLAASPVSEEVVEEVVIEPDSLEITDPTEVEQEDAPPEVSEVEVAMTDAVPDFMAAVSGDAIKPPAKPAAKTGMGKTIPKRQSSVFGTKTEATDYVFVIDNSNSMQRGRFETALHELMIAVNNLNKKQRFYVIFYSDTAYGMMWPNPVTSMVAATEPNKRSLFQWLTTVPLCLKTNGKEAIQAAFDMKPDVIYVLGDGAFTDGASKHFATTTKTKTVLHTRGMQVNGGLAKSFEALAKAHGGNYKDVGVHPAAAAMAQQNPRPKNNKKNGVWGITLPVK